MDDIAELIGKLEATQVGSRELDRLVHNARGDRPPISYGELMDEPRLQNLIGEYTTSLSAALTLVPKSSSVDLHIGPGSLATNAFVHVPRVSHDEHGRRVTTFEPFEANPVRDGTLHWNTPALAVCIAALKARAA